MKFLALLIAGCIWLLLMSMLGIKFTLSYTFQNIESRIKADFQILFSHLKVEINIPKEMLSAGFQNILLNITEDISEKASREDNTKDEKSKETVSPKSNRYQKIKHYQKEVSRHYYSSWSQLIWLNRKLHRLYRDFYRQVKVYSLHTSIQVGGRDAAETGLLTGAIWAFLGLMNGRMHRLVTVKKDQLSYHVQPCFEKETFLCKLNCILSLRISHIIFTTYKLLLFLQKNRRIRNYGRASN